MFYHIRQNRVPYLEIKLEMAKNPNKKKQRMKTDKKNCGNFFTSLTKKIADYWLFLALFQGKELCFVLCGKKFLIRPLPFGLNSCMTQQNKGSYQKFLTP